MKKRPDEQKLAGRYFKKNLEALKASILEKDVGFGLTHVEGKVYLFVPMSFIDEIFAEVEKQCEKLHTTEAELGQVREALEGMSETLELRRAPPDEAYWLLEGTGKPLDSSKVLVTEVINSVHVSLRTMETELQATFAGLLKRRDATREQLAEVGRQISELQTTSAEKRRRFANQYRVAPGSPATIS